MSELSSDGTLRCRLFGHKWDDWDFGNDADPPVRRCKRCAAEDRDYDD